MIEGQPRQVQRFERNRLELHPQNPRPYDVLLGRLGVDRLSAQGRDWFQFPKSEPRAGYDAWNWQDKALLRATRFLYQTDREVGGWWAEGDDEWMPWVVNHAYGEKFPVANPARPGKNLGWTDWVYGCL